MTWRVTWRTQGAQLRAHAYKTYAPLAPAGMVTTEWVKFREHKANGLVKDVFSNQALLDSLKGD